MKKKIEIEVEIPDYIDPKLYELFSKLSEEDLQYIKGYAVGTLTGQGKLSIDEAIALMKK